MKLQRQPESVKMCLEWIISWFCTKFKVAEDHEYKKTDSSEYSSLQFHPLFTCSRSTFEFPSRVNLSGLSLYCTWTGKAGATRLTRSDFMIHMIDLLLLQICVEKVNFSWYYCYLTVTTLWPRCSSRSDFKQKCNKTRFSLLYIWIENIAPLNSSSIEGIIKHFRF